MSEILDEFGVAISGLSLIAAIAAVCATYQIARRQDRQQREAQQRQEDGERRQLILTTCDTLIGHLTNWHDALRGAVVRDDIAALDELVASIERFHGNAQFQGPLKSYLDRLRPYAFCAAAIAAIEAFERGALEFKEASVASTLHDMVSGHGHWSTTKLEQPSHYAAQLNDGLEAVRRLYNLAVAELNKLSASQRLSAVPSSSTAF